MTIPELTMSITPNPPLPPTAPVPLDTDHDRWQAIIHRLPAADGHFFYGVTTTGIYCRPTCASRRPHRHHVRFFADWASAEAAQFRPCKRCSPRSPSPHPPQAEVMAKICRALETADTPLPLATLAQMAGLSPHHFHRVFRQIVGVTPRQYGAAQRAQRLRQQLHTSPSVTRAIYDAGFNTSSTLYGQTDALLGMTPAQYQQGGRGVEVQYTVQPCWLGWVLVATTPRGVCTIALGDTADSLVTQFQAEFPQAQITPGDQTFANWVGQVLDLLDTPRAATHLPLDLQGTAFQQQVWQLLQTLPPGTTASYGEVARRLGKPAAVRAVAQACGANRLAVAIPCHRVVGSDGQLRGYRWGRDRKQALLAREAALQPDASDNAP